MTDNVRFLVWNGSLNVQVEVDPDLLIEGVSETNRKIHFWIPRNCYITTCLTAAFEQTVNFLKSEPHELYPHIWFEYNDMALPWTIPLGVLYDTYHLVNHPYPPNNDNFINIWKIKLRYGKVLPTNLIPIIDGEQQIRKFVMHQWKQSCFILNGSSKQVMSLSVTDTDKLWTGLSGNDITTFTEVTRRIIPKTPRRIPLVVLDTRTKPYKITQPSVENVPVSDLLKQWNTDDVICQGIQLGSTTTDTDLFEIYKLLYSFDGFLYLII